MTGGYTGGKVWGMTNSTQTMTKAHASKLARKILGGGYFDKGGSIEQRCSECREVVSVPKVMGRTKLADLQGALVDHLYFDCGQPPL